MERTKTGIKGLDEMLNGGIPKNAIVLVSGLAGTGKTIFGLQFLVKGALEYGEKGMYISFEESRMDILAQAEQFGWNLAELEEKKMIEILSFSPSKYHLIQINNAVESAIDSFKPSRVVYDSISTIGVYAEVIADVETLMNLGLRKEDVTVALPPETITRRAVMDILSRLKAVNATALVVSELPRTSNYLSRDTISEFITDGVIILHSLEKKEKKIRAMEIVKMRRTSHSLDLVPMDITSKGVEVFVGEKVF